MEAIPTTSYTEEEYLEYERASQEPHEYMAGRIIPLARNDDKHNRIRNNISHGIYFRALDCYVLPTLTLAGKSLLYPDIVVVRGEPKFKPDGFDDVLLNPTVVIEIMSTTTKADDLGLKFMNYAQISSLSDYILVAQYERRVDHFQRLEDGEWPRGRFLTELNDVLEIASIDWRLTLAEIYDGINFE